MDKTGPLGTGPMGRGMGPCAGDATTKRWNGRGMGRGYRRGGGFGWRSTQLVTMDEEKAVLEERKSWLEFQVEAITQRLAEFQTNNENK
jgi:hypothetical protein